MKLEQFATWYDLPLEITYIVEKRILKTRGKSRLFTERKWRYAILSPLTPDRIFFKRNYPGGGSRKGSLLPESGKTKREARSKLVENIRGTTISYGYRLQPEHSVNVPKDLR